MNRIQKIVSKYSLLTNSVSSGDFVQLKPSHCMTHDNTAAVIQKYFIHAINTLATDSRIVFTLDHNLQDYSPSNLKKYSNIKSFALKHNIDFYPAGAGIGHQLMIENGYAYPNTLVVASDSHSNMYGGIGCLGTPIVRTDAAAIWATGQTWWQVPPVAKITFKNKLPQASTGKDVIIALCGIFNKDQVLNHALEFTGDISSLTVDDRLAIANMTTEWGALAGVFPVDDITKDWLRLQAHKVQTSSAGILESSKQRHSLDKLNSLQNIEPDENAQYALDIELDLSTVYPHISGPNSVKLATPLHDIQEKKIQIQKAYLVSCTNSRLSDLKSAANVLKGEKVKDGVELYVAAASANVQKDSENAGYWQVLLDAGAKPLPSGCGPCIGLGAGLLKDNEVGISASNRNYKGRMGSPLAQTYLSSPDVVAASAIKGYICGPENMELISKAMISRIRYNNIEPRESLDEKIYPGFNFDIQGQLLFCDQDNINTDGIYPGKYTYQDDLTPEKMASVVMENYDSKFSTIVQHTDILVGGFNFGTGSSREQAATALKYAGIKLVIAGSFSETFKRNAINNGLLVLEAPKLVDGLRDLFKEKILTRKTQLEVSIDLVKGKLKIDNGNEYRLPPVGYSAQEILVCGGLENWIKKMSINSNK